ncbi:hypothetical protein EIP86_006381 [Pleurotus ostreatoroseus]|nr:hypothetical protein EIP86_006381 [Pleurotus ostreatoroseus]
MVADAFERKFFFLLDNMGFAPGLAFLSLHIPHLVGPPIFVYLASHLVKAVWGFACPVWLLAIAYAVSWPLALTAIVQYNDWKIEREAAAYGAELPPCIPSQRLGGWDLVRTISETLEKRILGYTHWDWIDKYGPTYNFRVFFEDRIFTAEPDYIKRILATEFQNYEKGVVFNVGRFGINVADVFVLSLLGPNFTFQMRALLGTGVFNSDGTRIPNIFRLPQVFTYISFVLRIGEMWKFHRGMTRPFFNKDRIVHFDIFDR